MHAQSHSPTPEQSAPHHEPAFFREVWPDEFAQPTLPERIRAAMDGETLALNAWEAGKRDKPAPATPLLDAFERAEKFVQDLSATPLQDSREAEAFAILERAEAHTPKVTFPRDLKDLTDEEFDAVFSGADVTTETKTRTAARKRWERALQAQNQARAAKLSALEDGGVEALTALLQAMPGVPPQDAETLAEKVIEAWVFEARATAMRHHVPAEGCTDSPAMLFGITTDRPCAKRHEVTADGVLVKKSLGQMTSGQIDVIAYAQTHGGPNVALKNLAHVIHGRDANQPLLMGVPAAGMTLRSRRIVSRASAEAGQITRTRECWRWPASPGLMFIDVDAPQAESGLVPFQTTDEVRRALLKACPMMAAASVLIGPSASSGVHLPGGTPKVGGWRVAVMVSDAREIPEIAKRLEERAWLAGFGFCHVDKAGKLHERSSMLDMAIYRPEGLILTASELGPGVLRTPPAWTLYTAPGSGFLNLAALPELTAKQAEEVTRRKAQARDDAAPLAVKRRAEWMSAHLDRTAPNASPAEREKLARDVNARLEGGALPLDLELFTHGGGTVTVGELLQDPEKWHERRFADPLEPEYGGGDDRIAVALLDTPHPYIYSHAHGGIRYTLETVAVKATATNHGGRLQAVTGADFAAGYASASWLVKDVLPMSGVGMLYGPPGSGKSFLALDMLMDVARGEPWQAHAVKQAPVLYVAAEGVMGARKRLAAYGVHHGVNLQDVPVHVIAGNISLLDAKDVAALGAEACTHEVKLIVIDTLAQASSGADENSGVDMSTVLKHCGDIQAMTGALVLLVHHTGKDANRGARGWSGLTGAMDAMLELSRNGDNRTAKLAKQKDGDDDWSFGFQLTVVDLGIDAEGDPVTSCVVTPSNHQKAARKVKGAWENRVLGVVERWAFDESSGPTPDHVVKEAVTLAPLQVGKRDRRGESAGRALENLLQAGMVALVDGCVILR